MISRSTQLAMISVLLLPALAACSLLTIKTPDTPLPQRELNARMLTREYATKLAMRVEVTADNIAAADPDLQVQLNTLRWKLGASRASLHAATQMAPLMALLDTWTFSEQMRLFFAEGAGAQIFGEQTNQARDVSQLLAGDAVQLARGLLASAELARYQSFVERYAREHPLMDLGFQRASVVDQWVTETNSQATLLGSVGSVSQSMSDVSDRIRILGENAPSQAMWATQLAVRESGFDSDDLSRALARADESLARLSRMAEDSPEQLRVGIADLRASMLDVSNSLSTTWSGMMRTVHDEREALVVNVSEERQALVTAFAAERATLVKETERITDHVITSGGSLVRSLVREMFLYGVLLLLVLLGLPFTAGYYVGRSRGAHARKVDSAAP